MTAELIPNDELDALDEVEAQLARTSETEPQVRPPADFYHLTNGHFVVPDLDAWEDTPHGYFATGHWSGETNERDVILPYEQIAYIELHFDLTEPDDRAVEPPTRRDSDPPGSPDEEY
jgi:hypothetical protein